MSERGIVEIAQRMAELTKSIENYDARIQDLQYEKKSCEDKLEELKGEVLAFSQAGSR